MADKSYIQEMLADVGGATSHKRVITFSAFMFLSLAFLVNIFFEVKIEEFIYDGMLYVVAAGMGFSVAEYFSKREKGETKNTASPPPTLQPVQPDVIGEPTAITAGEPEKTTNVEHTTIYPVEKPSTVTEIINEGITEISGILQGED